MSNKRPTPRHTATISLAFRKEIDAMRDDFMSFAGSCQALSQRRKDLAGPFMKLFARYRRETGKTFVAYVHELDPKVPVAREGYVNHPTYRSALYLRRLIEAPHTLAGKNDRRTLTPFLVLAAMMHSFIAMAKRSKLDPVAVWASLKRTSHWDDKQIVRLQSTMTKVHPLPIPGAPRLVKRA